MANALRDPVTGNIIKRGDKAALDDNCAAKCCAGCWYRVFKCECDDRLEEATVNYFWRCEWADLIEGTSFEFEDLCYWIDNDSSVSEIPSGAENQEFPEGEIAALTWFDDCESVYEPGEEPELPPTQLVEGCCDPCSRTCDSCASAYTATVNLAYLYEAIFNVGTRTIDCEQEMEIPLELSPDPAECQWEGMVEPPCADCEMVDDFSFPPGGPFEYPIRHHPALTDFGVGLVITLHCPEPGDPNVYYRAVLGATICADDPCGDPQDACSEAGEIVTVHIEWRKPGVCPAGTAWALHSIETGGEQQPIGWLSSSIVDQGSTLEIS